MAGLVEEAIRRRLVPGQRLATPVDAAPFEIETIDQNGIVLLLGKKQTPTRLSWECLEGVVPFVAQRGRVRIGSVYSSESAANTLDHYLKRHVKRATAGWVAALLEEAGLVEIDRSRPATIRLTVRE